MKYLFILFAILNIYSYFLYPLILMLIPARRSSEPKLGGNTNLPKLSLIITAHNEEGRIQEKLENTLEIEYPTDLLEIIVASDCSTDTTDSIVESYANNGVRLVRADSRKGKEYAQLCAIREAVGEILVFSDVATRIEKDALRKLAERFSDQSLGALSSEDRFVSQDGKIVGEGAYVKYEMWLRRLESARAGLVGLSGSFFAARRAVCEEWDITVPSDFNTALNCAKLGLVAVTYPEVVGVYQDVKDPSLEYRRKTRTIIRGIAAIARHPEVLNPSILGMFAFQVWSHKILRWGVPWFMLGLFMISLVLAPQHWIYMTAGFAQIIFYCVVLLGHFSAASRMNIAVKIPYFYVQVNIAIAHATLQYLMGKRITVWEPSKR
jgi:cellulose synthase/poly-beta-1,6-N-acetylglucosamine synthase-like glycosyltransferase